MNTQLMKLKLTLVVPYALAAAGAGVVGLRLNLSPLECIGFMLILCLSCLLHVDAREKDFRWAMSLLDEAHCHYTKFDHRYMYSVYVVCSRLGRTYGGRYVLEFIDSAPVKWNLRVMSHVSGHMLVRLLATIPNEVRYWHVELPK